MKAEYLVLALFAVFAWYELLDNMPAIATGTTSPNVNNPLSNIDEGGSPTVGPTSQTNGTTLSQAQTGGGLFGNPTGLGSNPTIPLPSHSIVTRPFTQLQ